MLSKTVTSILFVYLINKIKGNPSSGSIISSLEDLVLSVQIMPNIPLSVKSGESAAPAELRGREGGTVVIQDNDLDSFPRPQRQN